MTVFSRKTLEQMHPVERDVLDLCGQTIKNVEAKFDFKGLRSQATRTFEKLLTLDSEHDSDYVRILQMKSQMQSCVSEYLRGRNNEQGRLTFDSYNPLVVNNLWQQIAVRINSGEKEINLERCQSVMHPEKWHGDWCKITIIVEKDDNFKVKYSEYICVERKYSHMHEISRRLEPHGFAFDLVYDYRTGADLSKPPIERKGVFLEGTQFNNLILRCHDFGGSQYDTSFTVNGLASLKTIINQMLIAIHDTPRETYINELARGEILSGRSDVQAGYIHTENIIATGMARLIKVNVYETNDKRKIVYGALEPDEIEMTKALFTGRIKAEEYNRRYFRPEDIADISGKLKLHGNSAIVLRDSISTQDPNFSDLLKHSSLPVVVLRFQNSNISTVICSNLPEVFPDNSEINFSRYPTTAELSEFLAMLP